MKKLTPLFILLSLIPLLARAADQPAAAKAGPVANGVYSVLAEAPKLEAVRTDKVPHAVLVYDRKYSAVDQDQPPTFVALDLSSFVPLILAGNPDMYTDERGHAALNLRLAREHVKTLEDFTRQHLGGRIAIVIDGEIWTMHKVQAVIRDGQAQITRCTDNACQRLYLRLTH